MIKSLQLDGFTCFSNNKFEFAKGINVLIGKNGTGKTHIMKCIAATLKANNQFYFSTAQTKDKYGELLTDALMAYFKPDTLGHLVNNEADKCSIILETDQNSLNYNFTPNMKLAKTEANSYISAPNFLYIPPREMLSLFEGFISLYEKREISFDETYIDLAKALNTNPFKGEAFEKAIKMVKPLLDNWDVQVIKKNGRFYVVDNGKEYEAHLVAEGLRKIATLLYLVSNGEIKPNSILFWDEPEANLNPTLISTISTLLISLAANGIQIFIATHDYLLTHRLSLHAEFLNESQPVDFRFFSLEKEDNQLLVENGNTLADIQNNAILDEYAAFYDFETQIMNQ